jgi:hypothetical protein
MVGYLFVSDPNGWGNWSLTIFQTGSGFSVAVSMGAYLNNFSVIECRQHHLPATLLTLK